MSKLTARQAAAFPPCRLHYVTDTKPGITRRKKGKIYHYFAPGGTRITEAATILRINALAIPPAYKHVWICPTVQGHLQATGVDSRGRKQYRYHPQWRAEREANKFDHILYFGEKLPAIRKQVASDITLPGLPREKVMATIVQLLEKTLIRVGNAEYARDNHSYGLTTLRTKHVKLKGGQITFKFTGKSGKQWNLSIDDRRIAGIIKKCEDIPGQELFKYIDDNGHAIEITSADVNAYLQLISGERFTAKDYRTWSATVLAALALKEFETFDSETEAKKNILRAIENVSKRLGNTPTICRKSYIHPEVINAYMDGDFIKLVEREIEKEFLTKYRDLKKEEMMVLAMLHKRLAKKTRKSATR